MNEDEPAHWLQQAGKCRRLAKNLNDAKARAKLTQLADEYEEKAQLLTEQQAADSAGKN